MRIKQRRTAMIFVGCLLLGAGPAAAHHILAGFLGSGESVLGNEPVALVTAILTVAVVFLGAVGLILFAKHRSPDGSSNSRSLRASAPAQKLLTSEDFPLSAEGEKLVTQQGERIADTESKPMAKDMAGRLNDDETRREEIAGRSEIEMPGECRTSISARSVIRNRRGSTK